MRLFYCKIFSTFVVLESVLSGLLCSKRQAPEFKPLNYNAKNQRYCANRNNTKPENKTRFKKQSNSELGVAPDYLFNDFKKKANKLK